MNAGIRREATPEKGLRSRAWRGVGMRALEEARHRCFVLETPANPFFHKENLARMFPVVVTIIATAHSKEGPDRTQAIQDSK
jgi:hypothetical protein